MNIKKGDTVKVISGDAKGKVAKVLEVLVKEDRVVVDGVKIVSRHTKPSNANPDGGIIKKEAPIHVSNVQLLDPSTDKPTRVGKKVVDGKKVRYAVKSGTVLDK